MKLAILGAGSIAGRVAPAFQALGEGAKECFEMPHEETIRIMEWMDSLRTSWGIKYPFE